MKPFRTIVTPAKPSFDINYGDRLFSMGSCFSEHIGKRLQESKVNITINPFGQQYNPHSIAQGIERLLSGTAYTSQNLINHNEQFHSWEHHGSFSGNTTEATLQNINQHLELASAALKSASVLFLTFGTAHVFKLNETGNIVSNCHKMPGNLFSQELMQPGDIISIVQSALEKLKQVNPGIKIVLTVSPVRYFAFGAYENSVSKSHLFTAIYALQKNNPDIYYFPAYELVMDDLRDYRFFADDMLHPNQQAISYVWESLANTFFNADTKQVLQQVEEIQQALNHRPRNPDSEAHKKFMQRNHERMEDLKKQYGIDW